MRSWMWNIGHVYCRSELLRWTTTTESWIRWIIVCLRTMDSALLTSCINHAMFCKRLLENKQPYGSLSLNFLKIEGYTVCLKEGRTCIGKICVACGKILAFSSVIGYKSSEKCLPIWFCSWIFKLCILLLERHICWIWIIDAHLIPLA